MNSPLSKRLLAMQHADQMMRRGAIAGMVGWDRQLDRSHTAELKRIIHRHGWPTVSLVGARASNAAWLVAQHADHEPEFQKEVLLLMDEIHQILPDEVSGPNIAYLTDRILVRQGKRQWFGTQHYFDPKGKLVAFPIDEPRKVNYRRRGYGIIETEAAYTRRLNREWKLLRG